jgi:ferredoxin-NADP reductase
VWLKLPYGDFVPSYHPPGRIVMLAGGSGITPFMSFIEWAVSEQPAAAIDLHYGARRAELLIYRAALERCVAQGLRDLRVRYYVEQPSDAAPLAAGMVHGRLAAEPAWTWLDAPQTCRFYLSGPKIMIDTLRANLVQLGAEPSAVLSDDWA